MIMGAAASTVYYNLKLRHPTLELPIIDYDLVLLIMPMLMLGISVGVVFNVIFADWMVTVLLIVLFLGNVETYLIQLHTEWFRSALLIFWLIFVFCSYVNEIVFEGCWNLEEGNHNENGQYLNLELQVSSACSFDYMVKIKFVVL